ncbi:YjcZ family sporulation protein [Alteribacillus sp. JSM 102045]
MIKLSPLLFILLIIVGASFVKY